MKIRIQASKHTPFSLHRCLAVGPNFVGCNIFLVACFFFLWRLVRPSQNGERAGPLAKMLLGAKHGGRPRIMSRIIVEEYFAL